MIKVWAEPERRRIATLMTGFLSLDEVAAFSREEQALVRQMGWRSGEYDLLISTREGVIQTREVMESFADLLHSSPNKARRIAVVRDGLLSRMQTQRALQQRAGTAAFDSLEAAEAWLAEPDGAAAAA